MTGSAFEAMDVALWIVFSRGGGLEEETARDFRGPEGWRMTGSAVKCFSMNGVGRCLPKMILKINLGL